MVRRSPIDAQEPVQDSQASGRGNAKEGLACSRSPRSSSESLTGAMAEMSSAQGSGGAHAGPEYTDLLSRGSFPLHTLNHLPNAPVLLRMLQLNGGGMGSMGRASFPSRFPDTPSQQNQIGAARGEVVGGARSGDGCVAGVPDSGGYSQRGMATVVGPAHQGVEPRRR